MDSLSPKDAFSYLLDLISNVNRALLSVSVTLFSFFSYSGFLFIHFVYFYFWSNWLLFCFACENNTFLTSDSKDRESLQIKSVGWQTAGIY